MVTLRKNRMERGTWLSCLRFTVGARWRVCLSGGLIRKSADKSVNARRAAEVHLLGCSGAEGDCMPRQFKSDISGVLNSAGLLHFAMHHVWLMCFAGGFKEKTNKFVNARRRAEVHLRGCSGAEGNCMPHQPKSILTRNTSGIINAWRIDRMHFPNAQIQDENPSEKLSRWHMCIVFVLRT